ncbi:MAG: DUF3187 family protein [Spirochaetota bacterium]
MSQLWCDPIGDIPLDIRNQYAPILLFHQPQAMNANTLGEGKHKFHSNVSLTNDTLSSANYKYSRDYYLIRWFAYRLVERSSRTPLENIIYADYARYGHLEPFQQTTIDMEYTNLQVGWDYGLKENLDIGVRLNFFSFDHGILDHTINDYHAVIGVKTGKERFPNDNFKYRVTDNRKVIVNSKPRSNLGDSVVFLKWQPEQGDTTNFSYSFFSQAKIPTGNRSLGMGSGRLDMSLGGTLQKRSGSWLQFANLGFIYVDDPFHNSTIKARNYAFFSYSLLYNWSKSIGTSLQVDSYSSPYRSHTILLSQPSAVFSLGLNWTISETSLLQIGFSEDISYPVPDISFFCNWKASL